MQKSGSKTGLPYYFHNSRGQKIENIGQIVQKTLPFPYISNFTLMIFHNWKLS